MKSRRTDTSPIAEQMLVALAEIRPLIEEHATDRQKEAHASIETFVAVALRVFAITRPRYIAEAALAVEIAHYIPKEQQ
jgi:hypothetical protein